MIKPSTTQVRRLLTFLGRKPTDLRPAVRWLMLGHDLSESLIAEDFAREPSLDQLLQLMRLLKEERPELIDTATLLTASSRHAAAVYVEVPLDILVDRDPDAWGHPVQILLRPRSSWSVLLAACKRRLQRAKATSKQRLRSVEAKLERAIVLEERARRVRRRRREARRKAESHQSDLV